MVILILGRDFESFLRIHFSTIIISHQLFSFTCKDSRQKKYKT